MVFSFVAVIVAMPEETSPLLRGIPSVSPMNIGEFPAYRFSDSKRGYVVIQSGIGPDRVRAAARTVAEAFSPDLIVSMGFGGAVSAGLEAGDIVIGTRLFSCDGACLTEETGLSIVSPPISSAAEIFSGCEGVIISTTRILPKKLVSALLPYDVMRGVVDMETCTVARFAGLAGIPFLAIRGVSDGLSEELGFEMDEFMDSSQQVRGIRVLGTALRRPCIVPQLFRLYRNTRIAGKNLSTTFALLRESLD